MGLDAAVYKRLEELPFTKEELRFITVDARTGQFDFEDPTLFRTWRDRVMAVSKRIGNVALVDFLRAEIERVLGPSPRPLLIRRVLYDGTHSGDVIAMEELPDLKEEVRLCRESSRRGGSPQLEAFLSDMSELIAASERHHNPIVFI